MLRVYDDKGSDEVGSIWLHRKPGVHDTAFMNSIGPRLHHIGFWLKDPMSLIDGCDYLAAKGLAPTIERGTWQTWPLNAFFLYLRDPDGHRIECTMETITQGIPILILWNGIFDDPQRQTFWGHEAPDSWFEEASTFLNVYTGEKVETEQPKLDKRKPNTII